jgi:peptidoglycan/xylan/chitin deacetylase (PgdA/CDA1 family)
MYSPIILAYHAVRSSPSSELGIRPAVLLKQLSFLRDRGYEGVTFTQSERLRRLGTLPPRCVVVTFDDGSASTLRALPILREVGFPATVFVVTNFMETQQPLRWSGLATSRTEERTPLRWEDCELLMQEGWEVGSHTVHHPNLTTIAADALEIELAESRATIIRRLGACSTISYPYGLANEHVADRARQLGYVAGCVLTRAHVVDAPLLRPRLALTEADVGLRQYLQCSVGPLIRRSKLGLAVRHVSRRSWAGKL